MEIKKYLTKALWQFGISMLSIPNELRGVDQRKTHTSFLLTSICPAKHKKDIQAPKSYKQFLNTTGKLKYNFTQHNFCTFQWKLTSFPAGPGGPSNPGGPGGPWGKN